MIGRARLDLEGTAFGRIFQNEVEHASDGIGAVLRGGTVTKHFHLSQTNGRKDANIRPVRTIRQTTAQERDHGGAMATLAIQQHQRLVRRKTAQVGGANNRAAIGNGLRVDVVGRHDQTQQIGNIRGCLIGEVVAGDGIHRRGGIRCGTRRTSRAHGDEDFVELQALDAGLIVLLGEGWHS